MTWDIRKMVKKCTKCKEFCLIPREPLTPTPLPERPWWRLVINIFEKDQKLYLAVVDYYSRYITVHELKGTSDAQSIVRELEGLFYLIGIPNTIVSDNGPQFVSQIFKSFLDKFDIQHITSSPRYPQSNGEAERAVRTIKALMNKNLNLHAALCMYRDKPLANGYSPAQLLFNRSLNSMGVMTENRIDLDRLRAFENNQKLRQKAWYDSRHATQTREPLEISQKVVVRDPGRQPMSATIVGTRGRETVAVSDKETLLRRNRSLLAKKSQEEIAKAHKAPGAPKISRECCSTTRLSSFTSTDTFPSTIFDGSDSRTSPGANGGCSPRDSIKQRPGTADPAHHT